LRSQCEPIFHTPAVVASFVLSYNGRLGLMIQVRACLLVCVCLALLWRSATPAESFAIGDDIRIALPLIQHPQITISRASWSAPIALSPVEDVLWVVNPDAGSLSIVDLKSTEHRAQNQEPGTENRDLKSREHGTVVAQHAVPAGVAEIGIGGEPWALALAPDGATVYVADRRGELIFVDTASLTVTARMQLGVEIGGIALSPSGVTLYATLPAEAAVVAINVANKQVHSRQHVLAEPYAIAVSNDGDHDDGDEHVYVTHFLALERRTESAEPRTENREPRTESTERRAQSPEPRTENQEPRTENREPANASKAAYVSVLDAQLAGAASIIELAPDEHGFPNLLAGIALQGTQAWVPQVRAAPALPNGLSSTVFAAVSTIDLQQQQEDRSAHLPLNDQQIFGSPVNNPVAAIPAPDGKTLYVVLAGSDLIEVIDISTRQAPRLLKFIATGANPRGMAISKDGTRGYVLNYLGRSVSVIDLRTNQVLRTIRVATETLDADVLRGKILFNTVSDPRMAKVSWVSCASCHADGGSDNVTWMFPDGPRQTPALWNAGETLPWHWSAALDEPQDVEDSIHTIQHGIGLATGADPPLLGAPNAGRSADLDALAAFLLRGIPAPRAAAVSGDLQRGRALFAQQGCASCHGGPAWTISALPGVPGTLDPDGDGQIDSVLRDVGTLNTLDIRGSKGFDVPTLIELARTAPYLHDGSLATLEEVIDSGHPTPQSTPTPLTAADRAALVAFLRAIDMDTVPLP
jgi:YVTN family beta-propeller protein